MQIVRRRAALSESRCGAALAVLGFAGIFLSVACQPTVTVGQRSCPASTSDAGTMPSAGDPISLPWSTGFEDWFCAYNPPVNFCTNPLVQQQIVTSPTKSGHYAAAFTVEGVDGGALQQSRCVRQGVLPTEAYYGAWYYLPATATNNGVWNLFHFAGGDSPTSGAHGLWDVSLVNGPNGVLNARVFNFLWKAGDRNNNVADAPATPIGSWFHLEFYLKRAKDATGEIALYQDGKRVIDFTNLITDNSDWGQWYVGNYATDLIPSESTLYVDDVTIAATEGYVPPIAVSTSQP